VYEIREKSGKIEMVRFYGATVEQKRAIRVELYRRTQHLVGLPLTLETQKAVEAAWGALCFDLMWLAADPGFRARVREHAVIVKAEVELR
jgi:hypothetical protein